MSWLTDYMKTVDAVSEAPSRYTMWAGISVMSATLKNNIWLNYRQFKVYPNLYIALVGPPGVGKGEAIHPAHQLAKDKLLVNYMSDRITAPRIIEKLFHGFTQTTQVKNGQVIIGAKDSTATLMSAELPTLLTSSEWMLQFLCDAWDRGTFDYDTRNKGSFTVTNMCVSLIGACVPDYIRKLNKDANATVSSGFSARTVFVHATSPSKYLPWASSLVTSPLYIKEMQDLSDRLQLLSHVSGEVQMDHFAIDLFDDYVAALKLSITPDDSDVYRNFKARQHIHLLKVAMTLAASDNPTGPIVITRAILGTAMHMIDDIAADVDDIFRGVGESDLSGPIARLQLYIERKGQVTYNQLVNDNMRFIDDGEMVRTLKILETIGFVRVTNAGMSFLYEHTGMLINPNKKSHTNGARP